jgi:hypothetical protein
VTQYVCLTVLVFMTMASGGLSAQEQLTLIRAVRAAMAQNGSLRATRATAAEAAAHITEARSGFFRVSRSPNRRNAAINGRAKPCRKRVMD